VVTPLAAAAVFRAAADAAVDASAPTTTFGSSARLRTGGSPVVRSYLRFHISGLTGTVMHARLRLYANSPIPSPGFEVHGVGDSSWSESSIAWANAPAPDAATTATSGPAAAGSWVEVDVTPLVTQDGDVSLALASAGAAALSLASRESGRPPQLVVESRLLRVGAFYYAWYGAARRHWSDGYVRHELTPPQAPQLGEYDSRDPAVLAQHFDWAHRNAIDFFAVSWWGAGEYSDVTTRDYLIRSPAIGRTKIAILYESLTNLGTVDGKVVFDDAVEAKLISDFDYLARTYFSSAHYQRVDGKPVVYLYVTRTYAGAYARAVADLRATIRARYGYDLYLVGDEVDWDATPDAARIGVWDAITSYTMYSTRQAPGWPDDTRFLDGVRSRYAAFKAVADAEHVAFIPDAMPGYDDRGVRLSVDHYVLPFEVDPSVAPGTWSLFSSFLGVAGDFVDPNLRTMVVTTFNEWHEDTELEPIAPAAATSTPALYTQGYTFVAHGRSLLDVLRRYAQTWRTPAG
jgi:hypothetical protein